jgi:HEAT repeat protein
MPRLGFWVFSTLCALPSVAMVDDPRSTTSSSPAGAPADAASDTGTCSIDHLLDELAHGLRTGSASLKRHLRRLLDENALNLSVAELHRALERSDDPGVVGAIAHALAVRASHDEDGRILAPVLLRALRDDDEAVRASIVTGLGGTGFLELAAQSGTGVSAARLARDESPVVRAALIDALAREDEDVYSGHGAVVAAATAEIVAEALEGEGSPAGDALAIGLLERVSTGTTTAAEARTYARALSDDDAAVRSAAARALSGLAPEAQGSSVQDLIAAYKVETSLVVRSEILTALARLLRVDAIPHLAALRPVDHRLAPEIDRWIAVLARGFQEWPVITRERQRLP